MFEWLTQPLSNLIGAGMQAGGGLMNASSTQAINAANLQNQMWSAQGGYLPGLVQNANKAGLNPLAVLGSRGPNMAVQVGTQPGAGLEGAGRQISQMDMQLHDLQVQAAKEEVMNKAATNKNLMIRAAIDQHALENIESNPGRYVPPGWSESARDTTLQGKVIDWTQGKSLTDMFGPKWSGVVNPFDWSGFSSRVRNGLFDAWDYMNRR